MEKRYIACDVCGCEIYEGTRIKSTRQCIKRSPGHSFAFDICAECFRRIEDECKKAREAQK